MAYSKHPVSIDGVEFDALIESTETLEADSPQFPTENGFSISDSIILKPRTLSMTLFVGGSVTWMHRFGSNPNRVHDVLKRLEELYFAKTPVTVTTTDKTYRNMAICSLEIPKTKELGRTREIPIKFQEIRVTEAQTTSIPSEYGKSGETGANAGTASTTDSVAYGGYIAADKNGYTQAVRAALFGT